MESGNTNRALNKVHAVVARKPLITLTAAAMALFGGATSTWASSILPFTAQQVPVSDSSSVFDTSNMGNTYALEPGTTLIPTGFDVRDLFGGSFGTFGPEQNDVIFDNGQPIGSAESIDVTLVSPVALSSFTLFLEDDGSSGDRSAREIQLFSNGQLIDDISILDTSGMQSYTSVYGSNYIEVSDSLSNLTPSSDYTLEFFQNREANGTSGIRALDFQAAGSATTSSVPEPASFAGATLIAASLLLRRRMTRLPL